MLPMTDLRVVSTDSHVIEPGDLFVERIDKAFLDRAPRLVPEDDGDWWYADGFRLQSVTGGTDAGTRFEDQTKLRMAARMSEVRAGAYDPDAKLVDMEVDGVDKEVVYTTIGLRLWRVPDTAFVRASFRAYNEWVAAFCGAHPDRLAGVALVLLDDIDDGITDLRDAARMGLKGAQITVHPGADRTYDRPEYEPFWAAAEELDMPLSLHIGSNRTMPKLGEVNTSMPDADIKFLQTPTQYSTASHWVACSISDMIFSGVFERHPGLKVVSLEHEASWAAYLIQMMDYTYTQRARRAHWHRFANDALPSDFFRNNVWICFQEDPNVLQLRDYIGVDTLIWGSDYPHHESTFPFSRKILDEMLADIPEAERRQILEVNPTNLYRFGK
jgi:predicted TIM-barrel fold metal-dependent hydrolase